MQPIDIFSIINTSLTMILFVSIASQIISFIFVIGSPHIDTSGRLLLNIIVTICLFFKMDFYITNSIAFIVFRIFLLITNYLFFTYLKHIKYYS